MKNNKKSKQKSNNLNPKGFFKDKNINPFMVFIVGLIIWSLASIAFQDRTDVKDVSMNEVLNYIKLGEVNTIEIDGSLLKVSLKNGESIQTAKEPQISFYELLDLQQLDPNLVSGGIFEKQSFPWLDIISGIGFPIASIALIWWIFRQAGRSSGGLFSIGKSKAKLFAKGTAKQLGFADVAGAKETKEELTEIVDFLKNPEKYRKLGARIPKGILLIGPSGVGKTLLARAVAGEADVPFYSVAGSEFIEMIVGVGSARVRDLFTNAKENSPSLVFIDEIDAIGRHRGKSAAVSNDEREQTLNQILVEMDGFDPRDNVIIIAATNRPDMLDTALVRPGRFDRHIRVELPDIEERKEIIRIHSKGKPLSEKVDIERIAKQTVGFSGADIENMLNEAAILAARKGATQIEPQDLSEASTKVKLGPGRKLIQTEHERKVIAYHEAGHALVGAKTEGSLPVTKVTIVSRAMSLGHTQYESEDNYSNYSKKKLLAMIRNALGGRAAEELVFDDITVGASNDIERATHIARKMVTDFGMSALGPINLVNENAGFWESNVESKAMGYSEDMARQIDKETKSILDAQYIEAKKVIESNRDILDRLVENLLAKETLEQDEFESIVGKNDENSESSLA